jgi:hypothetical protein
LKNVLILMFIGFFLFGCISTPEINPIMDEEPTEEVYTPPVEVIKNNPSLRFIDYPLELNAKEGARFVVEVKEASNVANNLFIYIWEESTNPSKYPVDYIYSSETVSQLSTKNDHYETYVIVEKPGKYYARSLVVIDGEYYWSEEIILNVLTEQGKNVRSFNIEITESNLLPSNIEVNKGDIIMITFTATENSHSNGVRILSPGWKDSPSLKPGQSFTVEFNAENSFSYRMFWLAGNLLKATGTVTVN